MEIPTLVISDPPQGEVDLEAAAELLGLDVFATRLKANFAAPEVMSASEPLQGMPRESVLTCGSLPVRPTVANRLSTAGLMTTTGWCAVMACARCMSGACSTCMLARPT